MRPESAGYDSLSKCITHLRAQSQLAGQPLVAESLWISAFCSAQVCLDGGFL